MTRHRRLVVALFAIASTGSIPSLGTNDAGAVAAAAPEEALSAARRFLDSYVDGDGRVVRRDQGDDTVGEGQAYTMLIAAGIGDEATFRSVWSWTASHLINDDGLLALRWDGGIVDGMPATDADLVAAGALALAAERFDDAELAATADRLSDRILAHETAPAGDGSTLLVAGPWAVGGRFVNPSYFVFPAMSLLWDNGAPEWAGIAAKARRVLAALMGEPPHLPPDWATFDGAAVPAASPTGASPRYGYEAVRVLVQLAADCDASRELAALAWPFLRDQDPLVVAYSLDGEPLTDDTHAVALIAAAAAARAAGDDGAADELLDRADALVAEHPSYYGAAWVALGRVWLDSDLLGGCAI